MRPYLILFVLALGCAPSEKTTEQQSHSPWTSKKLTAWLDTIWQAEQMPIRLRDSLMKIHGVESPEFQRQSAIVHQQHEINERKITHFLDQFGWPPEDSIGERGSLTICNVIQHSDNEVRLKYLPMMRQAVMKHQLHPRLLARAQDRIATEAGEPQIYGGQIKFYAETKSFDVWPIADPEKVDQRRAEIGLEPMAEFLQSRRIPLTWDLEKQKQRTKEFLRQKTQQDNLDNKQ